MRYLESKTRRKIKMKWLRSTKPGENVQWIESCQWNIDRTSTLRQRSVKSLSNCKKSEKKKLYFKLLIFKRCCATHRMQFDHFYWLVRDRKVDLMFVKRTIKRNNNRKLREINAFVCFITLMHCRLWMSYHWLKKKKMAHVWTCFNAIIINKSSHLVADKFSTSSVYFFSSV